FTALDQTIDEELIIGHWKHFLQSFADLSPAHKDLMHNQTPAINNNNIMLTVRNEAEARSLKKRLEEHFRTYCRKIGAPEYTLLFDVKMEEAAIKQFREQTAAEDQQMVMKTMQE